MSSAYPDFDFLYLPNKLKTVKKLFMLIGRKSNLKTTIVVLIAILFHSNILAQRVGDWGVTFDSNKYDPNYPEMLDWQKAGVQGGIPSLSESPIVKTLSATNSDGFNAAITEVYRNGGGQLFLENGIYDIDKKVIIRSKVRIVGESRKGVVLNITMTGSGDAIEFNGQKSALENLTVQGGFCTPNDFDMVDAMPDFLITAIYFPRAAVNCWLDKINILNVGNSAISSWDCKHITIRDCFIERAWNKGGGGHGYVGLQGSYILMTGCHVKYLRHISLQNQYCKYNVLYDNDFEQEVSFHTNDAGYNLIENNRITLSEGLSSNFKAIMTPWSVQHEVPGPRNAVYKNTCIENNNGGAITFSDTSIVYIPKAHNQVFTESKNTPKGGTFYPVIEAGDVKVEKVTISLDSLVIRAFEKDTLTATFSPDSARYQWIIWSSTNPEIVDVNKGAIQAFAEGEAGIIARSYGSEIADTCFISVSGVLEIHVERVELSEDTISIEPGEEKELTVTLFPEFVFNTDVFWNVENSTIATVEDGVISGKSVGETKVYVQSVDQNIIDSCVVIVSENVSRTYTETFENLPYTDWGNATYTGDNNFRWTVNGKSVSGYVDGSKGLYSKGVTLVQSKLIPNGISSFSLKCKNKWNSGSPCLIELFVNGTKVGSKTTTTQDKVYEFNVENINIPGDVIIQVRIGDQTIAIDDLS